MSFLRRIYGNTSGKGVLRLPRLDAMRSDIKIINFSRTTHATTRCDLTVHTVTIRLRPIITGYPIDGAMGISGEGRVRKLSVVCLHNNAIVARGILVTILHCGTSEPRLSAIYIVSSVGMIAPSRDSVSAP